MLITFENRKPKIYLTDADVMEFEYVARCMESIEKHVAVNNDAIGTRAVPVLLRAAVERFGTKKDGA